MPEPDLSRFDHDPDALAWARAKVQAAIDKAERCRDSETLSPEDRVRWHGHAYFMRHELLGHDRIATRGAFDERWPATLAAISPTTEEPTP